MRVRGFGRLVAVVALLAGAATARAQNQIASPYSLTVANEGPGFRLGAAPLVLHPGVAVDIGYDSNVFYLPSNEVGSGLLRLRAHFDLATLRQEDLLAQGSTANPKVDFRFSTQVEYREYLTDNATVESQRSVNINAVADLILLPRGPFTLVLNDTFARTVDPRNVEVAGNFSRDYNRVGFLGTFRRGGLEVGVGDYFQLNYWESKDLQFGNNLSDEAQAFARLRFLPQTVGTLLVRVGYIDYENNHQLNAVPFRALVGASSLFTSWFGASANIGYGNSFHEHGPEFNSVIANVEVRFFLPKQSLITLTYDRDFFDSLFANLFIDDHLSLSFGMPLFHRVTASAEGGVRFRSYLGLVDPSVVSAGGYSTNDRHDLIYEAHAEINVLCTKWLTIGASYNLIANDTSFYFLPPTAMGGLNPPPNGTAMAGVTHVNFIKHSAFVRADFAY